MDSEWARPGWRRHDQRGDGLGERIAHAFADSAVDGLASVLIGMDTPQVTGALLDDCVRQLRDRDAVLGAASDGGWWLLGLRDPAHARHIAGVPTSRPDTGERTLAALARAGLTVAAAPLLSDVDTAADAWQVAALCPPDARFPASVARNVAQSAGVAA